jgi:hypothetical protein
MIVRKRPDAGGTVTEKAAATIAYPLFDEASFINGAIPTVQLSAATPKSHEDRTAKHLHPQIHPLADVSARVGEYVYGS